MALDPMESSTTPIAGPSTQPETAFEKWRSSLAQLTDERLAQERLEGDWNQCEKWKTGLMKSSGSLQMPGTVEQASFEQLV
jgi:hypothetical protein